MKFYLFDQNNSGGKFAVNDKLCHKVLIEAPTLDHALIDATDMGIYFDGCDDGIDCPCCGDRWYMPREVEFPLMWDDEITFNTPVEYLQYLADHYGWTSPDARIYFDDGEVKEIFSKK